MRPLLEIALTGLTALRLHPLRTVVSFTALVVVLLPYLVGAALAKGLEEEAEASARAGADLYVSGSQFGKPAPIPLTVLPAVRRIDNVTDVQPRIVGEVVLGKERIHAVFMGMPAESLAGWQDSVEGRLPRPGQLIELVVGSALAERLGLKVGDLLPPFYTNRHGDRLPRVVGIFAADAPLWQANLILTTFDSAAYVFDEEGMATDLMVWCQPDSQASVVQALERGLPLREATPGGTVRLRVTAREDLFVTLPRGFRQREGVFNLHFVPAFAVAILVLLVTSGAGLSERRREIGILKATGWQTDEILLRSLAENVVLGLAATCASLLLAWLWLRAGNGYGIASLFLDAPLTQPSPPTGGEGWVRGEVPASVRLPFRLTPVPALLGCALALVIVLSGTLYSSWRAATAPPRKAMH
jgi:ABC-type lipoprotein release transport system permease subunit